MNKTKLLITALVMLLLLPLTCKSEDLFYYAGKETYSLISVPTKRATLDPPSLKRDSDSYVERIGARIHMTNSTKTQIPDEKQNKIFEINGKLSLPVFSVNNKVEVVLLPEIVVKPKLSSYDISPFVDKYQLKLVKHTDLYQIYSVPVESDVINIANKLYESNEFDFAYPNLFCPVESHSHIPNDPYFQYQIACHNTGQTLINGHSGTINADINAPEAWDITTGSPYVVVAVFDEGVSSNHPDLPNSRQIRLSGSNFGSGNPDDPSPIDNCNHGNACAGVIAATMDNNEGIAGIAPSCKIMPIRLDSTSSPTDIANGIQFAMNHGAKIISCSFGYQDSGSTPNLFPAITAAIQTAIQHNVVVLFSTGNTADYPFSNGEVEFPANADISNLITVGASDRYDCAALYSPRSSLIDFVAPSHRAYSPQIPGETLEMWSLDIPGSAGWNPTNFLLDYSAIPVGTTTPSTGTNHLSYTGYFGGTSHSCPVVAGVVALMLSVDPQLTPAQVYYKLKSTSAKVGGYTYVNGKCDDMGYGRVDAFAATWSALAPYIQGPDILCDTDYYQIQDCPSTATVVWSYETNINEQPNHPAIRIVNNTPSIAEVRRGTSCYTIGDPSFCYYTGTVTLKATISCNGASKIITKNIILHEDESPTIPVYQRRKISLDETRTFCIDNCTDVPTNKLKWVITLPSATSSTTYYGRCWSITTGFFIVQQGTMNIKLYNLENCDQTLYTNYNVTISYLIPDPLLSFANPVTTGTVDINVTDRNYAKGDGEADVEKEKRADIDYTLELWSENSRTVRTIRSTLRGEKDVVSMDVSNLPNGIYFLTMKVDNEILTTEKMIIIH